MILRVLAVLVLGLWALVPTAPTAGAHEIRPAFLQIAERTPGVYDLLWKVPTRDGMVQDIRPAFGPEFVLAQQPGGSVVDGFALFRYRLTGEAGLPGAGLRIDNLDRTTIDALVDISLLDGTHHSFLLRPRESAVQVPEVPSAWVVARTYTRLGIEHILTGIDHLAFVAALMLVVCGWPMMLKTVTAFTVAHSITLALSTFGYVSLPPPPVEALIALSIVLVAVEAIHLRRGRLSLATRWPWIVAFAFGLLHGFGFAGALTELGLPQGRIPLALLFFNLGVEMGQILFICVILALVASLRRIFVLPRYTAVTASYAIGCVASFWVFERLNVIFF